MKARQHNKNTRKGRKSQEYEVVTKLGQKNVKIALLGCGEVGSAVYFALHVRKMLPGLTVAKICTLNPGKSRYIEANGKKVRLRIPTHLFCTADEIIADPSIAVVVDVTAADTFAILSKCMYAGKHVVSANKALIARKGDELISLAIRNNIGLLVEACVQGKVPVLRASTYHLPLRPFSLTALLSGTCGFVLSEVEKNPFSSIEAAVKMAQVLKYAEADPTIDVEAFDATSKAKILARVFFGAAVLNPTVDREILRIGIMQIPKFAFSFAEAFKMRVQLVGTIEKRGNKIGIVVMPSFVPRNTFIGSLHGVTNGLEIIEELGPPSEYAGPGAGGPATAAAILGDLSTVVTSIQVGTVPEMVSPTIADVQLASFDDLMIRPVFLSSSPEKEAGIFCKKLAVVECHGLSVEQVLNHSSSVGTSGDSFDAIACHAAPISLVLKVQAALEALPCVHSKVVLMRIVGNEACCC